MAGFASSLALSWERLLGHLAVTTSLLHGFQHVGLRQWDMEQDVGILICCACLFHQNTPVSISFPANLLYTSKVDC